MQVLKFYYKLIENNLWKTYQNSRIPSKYVVLFRQYGNLSSIPKNRW